MKTDLASRAFAGSNLLPDLPDSVARMAVFRWVVLIFLVLLLTFSILHIAGYPAAAEKVYHLVEKCLLVLAGAVSFYLSERRTLRAIEIHQEPLVESQGDTEG